MTLASSTGHEKQKDAFIAKILNEQEARRIALIESPNGIWDDRADRNCCKGSCRVRQKLSRVTYKTSEKTKSEIYLSAGARAALPLLNSGNVRLINNQRLINQLLGLERRTSRQELDSVHHGPGLHSHDDLINAALGAVVLAGDKSKLPFYRAEWIYTEMAKKTKKLAPSEPRLGSYQNPKVKARDEMSAAGIGRPSVGIGHVISGEIRRSLRFIRPAG